MDLYVLLLLSQYEGLAQPGRLSTRSFISYLILDSWALDTMSVEIDS